MNQSTVQEKFAKAEALVREILNSSEKARNDDMELFRLAWAKEGLTLTPEQIKIWSRLTHAETLRRTRQKLQHDGLYKPSKRTKKMRSMYAEAQQIFFHNEKASRYETPVSNEEVTQGLIRLVEFMKQRGITADTLRNTKVGSHETH
jgi:hypothetical protein